jgi:hypothetical protein
MGRRLPDEVVYRMGVRIEAGEGVPAIAKAIEVARRTVYGVASQMLHEQYAIVKDKVYGRSYWLALIATAVGH